MNQNVEAKVMTIRDLIWGFVPLFAIKAGIDNHIFDIIAQEACDINRLSNLTDTSLRGLNALIPALQNLGLITKDEYGFYHLSEEAHRHLVSSSPASLVGLVNHISNQLLSNWTTLSESVKSGRPIVAVNQEAIGSNFFANFVEALFPMNKPAAEILASHLNLKDKKDIVKVLDIAAGSGVWGITLAQNATNVSVYAVDWPEVIHITQRIVRKNGLQDRFNFISGDITSVDFGKDYDIAILGHIIHSEGESRGKNLIEKCYNSLSPNGRIVIAEFLVNDDRSGPPQGIFFNLNMLIHTENGATFSFEEISTWLKEAGFVDIYTIEAPAPSPLIIAKK